MIRKKKKLVKKDRIQYHLQTPWKAIVEALNIAASLAFERSRPCNKQWRCSRVTGSLLSLCDWSGTSLATPFFTDKRIGPPSQGAPWKVCQNLKPANQPLTQSTDHLPA